jgi:hypothetical protein
METSKTSFSAKRGLPGFAIEISWALVQVRCPRNTDEVVGELLGLN